MKKIVFGKINKGFTLIELLVVIVIITILGIILMGLLNIGGTQEKAENAVRENNVNQIASALESYYSTKGEYPPTSDIADISSEFRTYFITDWPDGEPEGAVYTYNSDGADYGLVVSLEDSTDGCYKHTSAWQDTYQCVLDTCDVTTFDCENEEGEDVIHPSPTPTPTPDDEEERWRYCESSEECEPVGCACKCSGCGGFDYEDVVNVRYVDAWYDKVECSVPAGCMDRCCPPREVVCLDNRCGVRELLTSPTPTLPPEACTDTDAGYDIYTPGCVTDTAGESCDYCDNNVLVEYYCQNNGLKGSSEVECEWPYVCKSDRNGYACFHYRYLGPPQ
ncbi:prepilin-type N-terminal cleavage/methylation domain-containing protein [Patescibacteria group bacterium]|nr:prepilin-type N-terminal cleavage/methylation domain-containing protein [Patescibacteria group bacterium]